MMWRDLNITKQDWERTPAAMRTVLLSLQRQWRLLLIRCAANEKEIAALRQQATQKDDLKAEMAELRERLRQNSQNSSKPPSSDPPSQRTSEAQRIQRDAVRRLTKLIDEAKQIDDAVDDVAGVGRSDSLVQAIPTQPINNWRVEAHEQPCSIHFGNRLLCPAAGL